MSETTSASGGDSGEPFDARDLRDALGTFATGVTIVTTLDADGVPIGFTCNSFNSVSLSPPLVLWSLSLRSPNLSNFLQAPCFAVNVLAADQVALAQRFAQSMPHRFEGVAFTQGTDGVPLIAGCAGHFACRSETRYYSGDHVIFIGHVLHYAYRDCAPLVFHRGRYRALPAAGTDC